MHTGNGSAGRGWIVGAVLLAAACGTAQAANQWWDSSNASELTPGNGNWNTTEARWALSATPGSANPVAWTNGNDAKFAAGASSEVAVGTVTANTVNVSSGAVTLNGGGSLTVSSTLTLSGGNTLTLTNVQVTSGVNISPFASGDNNTLVVAPGATWNLTAHRFFGALTTGTGNLIRVDGGAFADCGDIFALSQGTPAGFNTLLLTNGGRILDRSGYTLYCGTGGSSNNTLIVTGPNTAIAPTGGTTRAVAIGSGSHGNTMRVENGAVVTNVTAMTLANGGGTLNALVVSNGCSVYAPLALVSGGSNNTVLLTANSTWNAGGASVTHYAIQSGTGNVFRIDGGAVVTNVYRIHLAYSAGANGNTLVITNGGRLFVTSQFNVGTTCHSNAVVVSGSNSLVEASGAGIINVGSGTENTLRVEQGGVVRGYYFAVGAGAGAALNNLVVTNGGRVYTTAGAGQFNYVAANAAGGSNLLVLTGNGSLWDAGNTPFRGNYGLSSVANRFRVENGAVFTNASFANGAIGYNGSLGQSMVVSNNARVCASPSAGSGSSLIIAHYGGGAPTNCHNTLTVVGGPDGDSIVDLAGQRGYVCYLIAAANAYNVSNRLTLGAGGVVTNAGFYIVTQGGNPGNMFNGIVISTNGRMYSAASSEGAVVVANAQGNTNFFLIDGGFWNGGGQALTVAAGASSGGNYVQLQNGGVATNVGALTVASGAGTVGNSVVVTNGARLFTTAASTLFSTASSLSNGVAVTGSGSGWDAGGQTLTMNAGTGNWLRIDQQGRLENVGTLIAGGSSRVDLPGGTLSVVNATVTNAFPLVVGDGVQAATLNVGGGNFVVANGLLVSSNASLRGTGSFFVGGSGLVITNGAEFRPGLSGPGVLTVLGSNMTWCGGGGYHCDVTDFAAGPGVGWSLLNVNTQLNLAAGGPALVIKLNSLGTNAANFVTNQSYNLRIATAGSLAGAAGAAFTVDTTAFANAFTGAWGVTNVGASLYVTYRGGEPAAGADFTWAAPSNGLFSTGGYWVGGSAPGAAGATRVVRFPAGAADPGYFATNDLGTFQLRELQLASDSAGTVVLRGAVAGDKLEFGSGGGVQQMGSGAFMVSNPVALTADLRLWGDGFGTVTLASNVTVPGR